jgi:integrase
MFFASRHLHRSRHGVYYFRAAVPLHLRAQVGRQEIRKSLQTRDRNVAVKAAQAWAHRVAEWFGSFDRGSRVEDDILKAIKSGNIGQLISFGGLRIQQNSAEEERQTLNTLISAFGGPEKAAEAFAKVPSPPESSPMLVSASAPAAMPNSASPAPSVVMLGDVIKEFLSWGVKVKKWEPGSYDEVKEYMAFWQRALCENEQGLIVDRPIESITRGDLWDATDVLYDLPPFFTKGVYKGKTLPQIVDMRIAKNADPQMANTVRKKITWLGTFFDFASDEAGGRYTMKTHGRNLHRRRVEGDNKSWRAFNDDELKAIFVDHPVYAKREYQAPWQYFIPLIALYSGARQNEIAQLHLDDIYQADGGIWVMSINANTDETATIDLGGIEVTKKMKSVKAAASKRIIPIHSAVINAGFIDYYSALKRQGGKRVFPELKWRQDTNWGGTVSKWFNNHLCDEANVTDSEVVFHSFRHLVLGRLKNMPDLHERFILAIGGHEQKISFGLYGGEFRPSVLKPIIERLNYGLTHARYDEQSAPEAADEK